MPNLPGPSVLSCSSLKVGAIVAGAPELWTVGAALVLALVCLGFAASMTAAREQ